MNLSLFCFLKIYIYHISYLQLQERRPSLNKRRNLVGPLCEEISLVSCKTEEADLKPQIILNQFPIAHLGNVDFDLFINSFLTIVLYYKCMHIAMVVSNSQEKKSVGLFTEVMYISLVWDE